MARLTLLVISIFSLIPGIAQQDEQFRKAGVCGRCHVISVVEWGMSRHSRAGTDCVACHGVSQGHVVDERNNVKPEVLPHGAAISTTLCLRCHKDSRSASNKHLGCESCHQVHALINPNKPPAVRDEALEKRAAQWKTFAQQMEAGERAFQSQRWEEARVAFLAALKESPADRGAAERLRACQRRLAGALPGFEVAGSGYDERTGLPREVRVSGIGISMLLVPGSDFQMGSERLAGAKPVHTVTVEAFYLAKFLTTQAEWKALLGSNLSTQAGERLPVESVSWEDAQVLLRKLNETVPGGGFRLPTEAEWEFTARSGAIGEEPVADIAWFDDSDGKTTLQPVGSKKPDKLGFFDLRGDVWEWRRRANWKQAPLPITGGYQQMYVQHVMQASDGADLDFLVGCRGTTVTREAH